LICENYNSFSLSGTVKTIWEPCYIIANSNAIAYDVMIKKFSVKEDGRKSK